LSATRFHPILRFGTLVNGKCVKSISYELPHAISRLFITLNLKH